MYIIPFIFQADLDGDRFMEDLKNNIQSQTAFDAIIRVRTSQGMYNTASYCCYN